MADQFSGVVDSLLKGMDTVLSTKTVVGEATQVGDTIILPLVDVSFGVAAGAGANGEKKSHNGAGGMGGKMTPSAVLVINKNGSTRLVNIKNQDTVTKLLDMIPDLVDRFTTKKEDRISDTEVVDVAFPERNEK
ncbi:MAG: GerW family sporulation protein [Lachnospiraceae bacterium]|nr:GerW family sporulation protein [Lachnospiraceae bacterium]MBQ7781212.1 GerW family sporulation protein [Lachnospiraceae bacterium]